MGPDLRDEADEGKKNVKSRNRWSRGVAALAAITLALTLAACGSGGGSDAKGPASAAQKAKYQATLDAWYKGTYQEPKGPAVKPPTGKTIWLVEAGLGSDYATRTEKATQEAAAKLGWTVHVFDAKFDPTQMLTGVEQAVVAKPDGIVVVTIDCPIIKNGLEQAKAAGIPVVGIEDKECDPGLFTHMVTYAHHQSFTDYVTDWGRAQADWVIAKTGGQANVVMDTETDSWSILRSSVGIKDEIKKCPGCSIAVDTPFVVTDLGPALQQKIQQALVQHPDANAYIPAYDVVMTQSGGAQAIQAAGRSHNLTIGGGEGGAAAIDQIRKGSGEQACAGQSAEWEAYSALDAMARIFLKQDPDALDTGNGIQVCDKDHNLPPEGQPFTPPVDFRAAFLKMWGLS